jgi:hypothetical protein
MPTPGLPTPNDRGKRWLQAKVQEILAASAVALGTSRSESDPACYWGTGLDTSTTLYLRLAGDLEPKALPFRQTMIADCGAGLYFSQHNAILWLRRRLKKMGIVSTKHA